MNNFVQFHTFCNITSILATNESAFLGKEKNVRVLLVSIRFVYFDDGFQDLPSDGKTTTGASENISSGEFPCETNQQSIEQVSARM